MTITNELIKYKHYTKCTTLDRSVLDEFTPTLLKYKEQFTYTDDVLEYIVRKYEGQHCVVLVNNKREMIANYVIGMINRTIRTRGIDVELESVSNTVEKFINELGIYTKVEQLDEFIITISKLIEEGVFDI